MTTTRRDVVKGASVAALLTAPISGAAQSITDTPRPLWRRGREGQRQADLDNGRFFNPVIAGDRADPTVLKDGDDYYATHTSFDYYPGVLIWHSRDLVNWTPLKPALTTLIGSVFAMDIAKVGNRYFIYLPTISPTPRPGFTGEHTPLRIFVIHATSMAGPWSEPIDTGISTGIDPGHVVGEDGKRYLYLNAGQLYPLSDDGLRATGGVQVVYGGWPYPRDWVVEGFELEGPKLLRKDGWFYLFSAQGGTGGPPTGHMIVVSRSRSAKGPWENGPHNPLVRTRTRFEPWWSRGHGTAVEGPDGRWWLVYHGYENGFRTLGRQMLLEPIAWGADGWPRALGGDLSQPLQMPTRRSGGKGGSLSLSDSFSTGGLGITMAFHKPGPGYLDRVHFADRTMLLKGDGPKPDVTSTLAFNVGDRHYEMSVEIELADDASSGLLLWYDSKFFCGIERTPTRQTTYKLGQAPRFGAAKGFNLGRKVHLKVINRANVASFYSSADGSIWTLETSYDVSGYNHNTAGGFLSLRPALFACGAGEVSFRNLRYVADDREEPA